MSTLLDRDGQPSFVFHSGDPMSIRLNVRRAQPVDDFVFGIGLFNADGVCCYGTNTYHRGDGAGASSSGDGEVDVRDREPRSRRRHLQARRRRAQARRLPVRLPSPALHVPGEVAHARRRHLPAAPSLDVLGGARSRCREPTKLDDASDPSHDGAVAGRSACSARPDDRLHQRRLRSAASRPCPLSAASARRSAMC